MAPPPTTTFTSTMSIAARARAAADLPSVRLLSSCGGGGGGGGDGPRSPSLLGAAGGRAPSSGNAGVSRGKFSPQQVKAVLERWGRDDDDDDDDDDGDEEEDEDDDEYCWGPDASDTSDGGGVGGGGGTDQSPNELFMKSLARAQHHLVHTMSGSPEGRASDGTTATRTNAMNDAPPTPAQTSTRAEEKGYRYQHHRVSAYANAAASSSSGNDGHGAARARAPPSQPRLDVDDGDDGEGDDEDDEWGLGLFASARTWLQSQRDRLHQLELERQVEDQRRKLVEEGRRQRALAAERRGGFGGVAEGEDALCRPRTHSLAEDDELIYSPEQAAMPYLICGFGTPLSDRRKVLSDESSDFLGVPRIDSSGNVVEMIPSHDESNDEHDGDDGVNDARGAYDMKVSSPRWTRSGEGMSVKVDYPDFDDNVCVIDNGSSALFEQEGGGEVRGNDSSFIAEIKIVPEPELHEVSSAPPILQPSHMESLILSGCLPPSLNFCKWKRLYSLARDGDSFEQFLRLVDGHERTVLVVLTTHGRMFGGYADSRWEARHTRHSASDFYGSAQACLFRFPNYGATAAAAAAGGGGKGGDEDRIIIYKWSGSNRYIQLCDAAKRALAFGGGGDNGYFGLCIEDDFRRGTTGHCSTFENEALCEEGYFECEDLEVWGFILDF